MEKANRLRYMLATGVLLAVMVLAWSPGAFALNPALDVSQYASTAWKVRDGFPKGQVISIVQTPDGYLWLGTEFGLFRFDGIRTDSWHPPPDQHLPSSFILSLLVSRDGTLWIGTRQGLVSWKADRLTQYAELNGNWVFKLLEDHEGTAWASGGGPTTGKLCAFRNGALQCYGDDGVLGRGAFNLYEDSKGNLWAGVKDGIWRWRPGPPKFYPLPGETDGIQGMAEDDDGALLLGWNGGIKRFVDGKIEAYPLAGTVEKFYAHRLLRDRDGGLWIGTPDRGLMHVHQGRADVFAEPDGLSGEFINCVFEDREGSIWVGTTDGLDRFRDFAVATFTVKQGLSNALAGSVLAARDGSVWLGTYSGLNRWNNGQITIFADSGRGDGKLNGLHPDSLFQDDGGRIWASTNREFGYLDGDRFIPVKGLPGGVVNAIAEDNQGNLWIANEHAALLLLLRGNVVRQIPWSNLGHKEPASALAADRSRGGLWIGFAFGGVSYFTDGHVRASYGTADGLGEGRISDLTFDRDGTLWAATDGGLSRLKNGGVATLNSLNGLPCDTVHWVTEDDSGSFWLYTACGLVRIAGADMDEWAGAAEKGLSFTIRRTVFDSSDGARSLASVGHFSPQVGRSPDGRLWFLPWDGVSLLDPKHLPFNSLPPPMHIEKIIADRKPYDTESYGNGRLPLPALVRDLEIDYTALSLVAPEKVLFRYKLEGHDTDWQEAGTRRQAFYTDLPPRSYRFRVMACNNSGVWNEAGAFLDFAIAPAYYQTTLFRLSCAAAFLLLLVALYQLRVRQVARRVGARLEGRLQERERIARDLHDTLLQSFQGLLLKFQAGARLLPDRPDEAKRTIDGAMRQAKQAVIEGRDAIQGLRSAADTNDLAVTISRLGEELASNQDGHASPGFEVFVAGSPRDLDPLLRDEVNRIAGEAVRNAFRHAQAGQIEVEICYDRQQFRLLVRDNGKGVDPKVLDGSGRAGHYGLAGMRERAGLAGGDLAVWSQVDSGTEIELTIPASVAYAKSPGSRRLMFFRKKT